MTTIPDNIEHIEAEIASSKAFLVRLRRHVFIANLGLFGVGVLLFVLAFYVAFCGGLMAPVIGLISWHSFYEWHRDGKNYGFFRFNPELPK